MSRIRLIATLCRDSASGSMETPRRGVSTNRRCPLSDKEISVSDLVLEDQVVRDVRFVGAADRRLDPAFGLWQGFDRQVAGILVGMPSSGVRRTMMAVSVRRTVR
jgi:hypothetical protein